MMRLGRKIIFGLLIAAVATAAICYFAFRALSSQNAGQESPGDTVVIQPKDYAKLLFVGDLFFDRGIRYYAQRPKNGSPGSNEFIFEKISPLLLSDDLVIANLEGPITNYKSVSIGTGVGNPNNFVFTFDPSLAKTLFEENIRMVDLGNNHILNFGHEGLSQTKKYLDQAKVDYFGVPDGARSAIEDVNGLKIAFVSYNEFYGKQELEKKASIDEIKKIKLESDVVVVFCHWGVEYAKNPTEPQKELAHQFIDSGADLVVGSHSHVIGLTEEYPDCQKAIEDPRQLDCRDSGKRIYYSLGNFVFDQYGFKNCQDGLGVEVKIDKATKEFSFKEVNFYMQPGGQTILK